MADHQFTACVLHDSFEDSFTSPPDYLLEENANKYPACRTADGRQPQNPDWKIRDYTN
jgi:hypothetical protein